MKRGLNSFINNRRLCVNFVLFILCMLSWMPHTTYLSSRAGQMWYLLQSHTITDCVETFLVNFSIFFYLIETGQHGWVKKHLTKEDKCFQTHFGLFWMPLSHILISSGINECDLSKQGKVWSCLLNISKQANISTMKIQLLNFLIFFTQHHLSQTHSDLSYNHR